MHGENGHLNRSARLHRVGSQLHLRAALFATTALTALAVAPAAQATDGFDLFPRLGLISSIAISGNGNSTVRITQVGGSTAAVLSSGGTSAVLPGLVPGDKTIAYALNLDGSVIVGSSYPVISGFGHATMWNAGGTVVIDLHTGAAFDPGGSLDGYTYSTARGVNSDGSVVVGYAAGPSNQAFRWTQATGMVGLGFLAGYDWSYANAVSGDGQTVVGSVSQLATALSQAAYWTQGTGWVGLTFLPGGTTSYATAISRDGSVIVGSSENSASRFEAFRWTQGGGMEGLGTVPGGNSSRASAVNADGSVVVGEANTTTDGDYRAMRWTRDGGMQTLSSFLNAGGVKLGSMTLLNATGVSDNGKVVVGYGRDASNAFQYFIARCESALCQGLVTLEDTMRSFAGQSAVGHTANAAIGGVLGTMQEYVTQAHQSQGSRSTPFSVFAYGAYDSDPVASGTLGMTVDLPFNLIAGFSASANHVTTEMQHDGSATMTGGAFGGFIAHMPDTGLQWLAGASTMSLKGDITRAYLNGAMLTSSMGSTSSSGSGFIGRAGWTFAVLPQTKLTPFASYTTSVTRFAGYTESTGVFPASFDPFKSKAETLRLGADARYALASNAWVWGTVAWGHRLDGGKAPDITGTLIDAFPITAAGVAVTQDWLEVGGGVRLPTWKNGAVTASLTASVPTEGVTTYLARLGLTQAF